MSKCLFPDRAVVLLAKKGILIQEHQFKVVALQTWKFKDNNNEEKEAIVVRDVNMNDDFYFQLRKGYEPTENRVVIRRIPFQILRDYHPGFAVNRSNPQDIEKEGKKFIYALDRSEVVYDEDEELENKPVQVIAKPLPASNKKVKFVEATDIPFASVETDVEEPKEKITVSQQLKADVIGKDTNYSQFTKKELACILCGVPKTGTSWLDDIIQEGNTLRHGSIKLSKSKNK